MQIGVSILDGRIAPVFDVSKELQVIEYSGNDITSQELFVLPENDEKKVEKLCQLKIEQLLCGAISGYLQQCLQQHGIVVTPFLNGDYQQIVQAWRQKRLHSADFVMPGCGCRRRKRQGQKCRLTQGYGRGRGN